MNPEDLPESVEITISDECDCPLCAMEIEVEFFEGVWFATSPYAPGLIGSGFCEEEAVGELVGFLQAIPLN